MYSEKLSQFVDTNRPTPIHLTVDELREKLAGQEAVKLLSAEELRDWGMYDVHQDAPFFLVQMDGREKTSYIPPTARKWWEKVLGLVFDATPWTLPHERGEVMGLEPIGSSPDVVRLADNYQMHWYLDFEDGFAVFTPQDEAWKGWLHQALGITPVRVQLPEPVVTLPREPWRQVWAVEAYDLHDECLTCFASEVAEVVEGFIDQLAELVEKNPIPGYKAYWLREFPEPEWLCPECQSVITSGIRDPEGDYDDWWVHPHCPECGWENGLDKDPYEGCLKA